MSESQESLRQKLEGAEELGSVVRTMKVLASSNIGQYEKAVRSLQDYYQTVEMGLGACLRLNGSHHLTLPAKAKNPAQEIIVFGSDQGLVGQFNETLAESLTKAMGSEPAKKAFLVVGERMQNRLIDAGLPVEKAFPAPTTVSTITPLVNEMLLSSKAVKSGEGMELYIYHNTPNPNGSYSPQGQRVLPLDEAWLQETIAHPWPGPIIPQVISAAETLKSLLSEYIFVTLFKACAESLNSENVARMIAMQRAEKNISELLEVTQHTYNRLRQNAIDEELFDVISGFEAMNIK